MSATKSQRETLFARACTDLALAHEIWRCRRYPQTADKYPQIDRSTDMINQKRQEAYIADACRRLVEFAELEKDADDQPMHFMTAMMKASIWVGETMKEWQQASPTANHHKGGAS